MNATAATAQIDHHHAERDATMIDAIDGFKVVEVALGRGYTCLGFLPNPTLLTEAEAAKSLGYYTIMLSKLARLAEILPTIVAGTEKNKYPRFVFTPNQVELLGRLLADHGANKRAQ